MEGRRVRSWELGRAGEGTRERLSVARSSSEVEWSMGRREGAIDLRGEVQGEY